MQEENEILRARIADLEAKLAAKQPQQEPESQPEPQPVLDTRNPNERLDILERGLREQYGVMLPRTY